MVVGERCMCRWVASQSVMRALDNPLKYALKLIEDDLVHAEQEIKVCYSSLLVTISVGRGYNQSLK